MLSWKLYLQPANWSKFKSLAWSIRVLQGALPKQPMTKLWLTFHYPIALDCCCIRVVNQKKWHSFLKLLQPPSTWESSNHVNPEVPHHKKQKRLVNVKTICTCCRLIDSTTSFAYRMHLDSNHTSTGQRKGRRVGDLLKNNGLGKNRNACVTSILQIEWPQTFAERFMLIVTVNDDRGDDGPGVQAAVYRPCNLTEVGRAQQSKISQHHQQHATLRAKFHPPIHRLIQWMTDSAQTFNLLGEQPSSPSDAKQHVDPMQTGPASLYVSVMVFNNKHMARPENTTLPPFQQSEKKSRGVQTAHWPTIETWDCRDESKDYQKLGYASDWHMSDTENLSCREM